MPILKIENLCKSYSSFKLNNVSFEVEKGSITGFIGKNGAGKSTTIKSMLDIIHYDSGTIQIPSKEDLGVVLGGVDFYPKSKLSSIKNCVKDFYLNVWDEEKYVKYVRLFEINDSKKADELSSGMKVKFMIALALSHNAKLLIFDEPTSGLDPVSRDDLCMLFKSLVKSGERSIFFSTHITSDLEKCADHIVYIKDGTIIDNLTLEDFMKKHCTDEIKTLEDIIVNMERRDYDDESFD